MNASQLINGLHKFVLTLYVATNDEITQERVRNLSNALGAIFKDDAWKLNVVEVLDAPEQAIANDIFTTPTLVRENPPPTIKVLDSLENIPNVVNVITKDSSH
jgi:hypothetical protein